MLRLLGGFCFKYVLDEPAEDLRLLDVSFVKKIRTLHTMLKAPYSNFTWSSVVPNIFIAHELTTYVHYCDQAPSGVGPTSVSPYVSHPSSV